MPPQASTPSQGSTPATGTSEEQIALPVSFAQELLWLVQRSSPESPAYNVRRLRRLRGTLDVAAPVRGLRGLAARGARGSASSGVARLLALGPGGRLPHAPTAERSASRSAAGILFGDRASTLRSAVRRGARDARPRAGRDDLY